MTTSSSPPKAWITTNFRTGEVHLALVDVAAKPIVGVFHVGVCGFPDGAKAVQRLADDMKLFLDGIGFSTSIEVLT